MANNQGGARPCLLLYCKIFLGSPSSFTPLESQQRWNAIWLTEKRCFWGERYFLIVGRPGNQPSASLEGSHPPAALLPNTFFSEFPWSSAFPGGRRRLPSPEGFTVDSTGSEVSAFLYSAQSPLRPGQRGEPGSPGGRQKAGSFRTLILVPLRVNLPPVSPFLSCPLHPHTSHYSSGPSGWLRWNSFILSVMPCT